MSVEVDIANIQRMAFYQKWYRILHINCSSNGQVSIFNKNDGDWGRNSSKRTRIHTHLWEN